MIAHDRTSSIYYYSRVPPGCVVVDIAINESGKGFTIRSGSFDGADFHGNVPGKGSILLKINGLNAVASCLY